MISLHPFEKRASDYILQHQLIEHGDDVLAAVSGGPDSLALLHVLLSLRKPLEMGRITILHFDHRLRGEDSDADRAFVEATAQTLGLPCLSERQDVLEYHLQNHISLEMAARACRHRFFRDAMERLGARRLALGHTANDQAEEVLLRLLRGAGPSGTAGMLPKTDQGAIRPLLFATRPQILHYLHEAGLAFREDASNLDPFCQRNALRLKVFPVLEEHFHHRVAETISRHTELVQDEEDYWNQEIQAHWPAILVEESRERTALRIPELSKLHPALQRRMLRYAIQRFRGSLLGIYAVHIEVLCRWITRATSGRSLHLPAGLRAAKEAGERIIFFVEPQSQALTDFQLPLAELRGPGVYRFPSFHLDLSLKEAPRDACGEAATTPSYVAWIDADKIKWPLLIRSWQPGDRFHPLGLGGAKKLQDYFTDSKIPAPERKRIPLLCDQEKICWIVGYRLDDRVKVTRQTKRMLVVRRQDLY